MDDKNVTQTPMGDFFAAPAVTPFTVSRYQMWATLALIIAVYSLTSLFWQKSSNFPISNYNKTDWTYLGARSDFRSNAMKLIAQGFEKFKGPFNVITDGGRLVMLPPDYIDFVNHEKNLNFNEFTARNLLAQYDTFKSFRVVAPGLIEEAVMKGLTRSLPKFTKTLSEEMSKSLSDTWGTSEEWHTINLRENVLDWVARLSSRIFNGDRLTHSQEWLRISKEFTVTIFNAVRICKSLPWPLRYPFERFSPICRKVRRDRATGAKLLAPILAERRAEIALAKKEHREPVLPDDSIEWLRNSAKGRYYDDTLIQLGLSMAAIHTTSDLLGQAIINLGMYSEMIEPLREEAIRVLREYGWSKVALTELRLLDSVFKETQRLKPISMSSMHRIATSPVTLPNGVVVQKGESIGISSHRMWSESDYSDPAKFDGYRFVKRRQIPGLEHKSHLIATSAEHTAFAHGKHACPGRFFAANEVKIAMVHVLLKYDFRLKSKEKEEVEYLVFGTSMIVNPKAKVEVRRRKEEIDLESL